MRYCEQDFKRDNPNAFQNAVYFIILIVFAPLRLFSTISKKLIFLGEYAQRCIVYSIVSCTLYMSVVTLYNLFISGRIYITGGSSSIITTIISVGVGIGIYVLFNNYSYDINLDALDNIEKDRALDIIKDVQTPDSEKPYKGPLVDDEGTVIIDPINFKGNKNIPEDKKPKKKESIVPRGSTLTEEIVNNGLSFDFSELDNLMESSRKTEIDNVYKNDDMEVKGEMLENLKNRVLGHLDPKQHITDEEFILGEHNEELAKELGFSVNDLSDFEDTLTDDEQEDIVNSVHEHLTGTSIEDSLKIGDIIGEDESLNEEKFDITDLDDLNIY